MTRAGVLKATTRQAGATVWEPGPTFDQYRQEVEIG